MQSTRRGVLMGLGLCAVTPALTRAGGAQPAILPPSDLIFPTAHPTMALTDDGEEITEVGRQIVRLVPVPGRPRIQAFETVTFPFRRARLVRSMDAALFARDGRYVCPIWLESRRGPGAAYSLMAGDTLHVMAAQFPEEICAVL